MKLRDYIRAAVEQAKSAYKVAIDSKEQLDQLLAAIPPSDGHMYKEMRDIREQAVQVVSRTYDIKDDLQEMEHSLQALENVIGEYELFWKPR